MPIRAAEIFVFYGYGWLSEHNGAPLFSQEWHSKYGIFFELTDDELLRQGQVSNLTSEATRKIAGWTHQPEYRVPPYGDVISSNFRSSDCRTRAYLAHWGAPVIYQEWHTLAPDFSGRK